MEIKTTADCIDSMVDTMFIAVQQRDSARIIHELNSLRRLAGQIREYAAQVNADPSQDVGTADYLVNLQDIKCKDVLLKAETTDDFWRVLRVRKSKRIVDVISPDGRYRSFPICYFSKRWARGEGLPLTVHWRYLP